MKLLITADWHIRATRPRCRVDEDWMATQRKALEQITNLAIKNDAWVVVVGDIFHSNSDTSFECINMVQQMAKEERLHILAGNHDLPYHNSENMGKSAIGILFDSDNICRIPTLSDLFSAPNFGEPVEQKKYMFLHTLTIPKEDKPDFIDCETPETLLEKYPKAKWIFTGDYHRNFHYEKDGRHVINPGCILRQAADFADYQPGVYIVDLDCGKVEFEPILDNIALVDDSYIAKENEREERIERFVKKLQNTSSVSFDFLENVKAAIIENRLDNELVQVIDELLQ